MQPLSRWRCLALLAVWQLLSRKSVGCLPTSYLLLHVSEHLMSSWCVCFFAYSVVFDMREQNRSSHCRPTSRLAIVQCCFCIVTVLYAKWRWLFQLVCLHSSESYTMLVFCCLISFAISYVITLWCNINWPSDIDLICCLFILWYELVTRITSKP